MRRLLVSSYQTYVRTQCLRHCALLAVWQVWGVHFGHEIIWLCTNQVAFPLIRLVQSAWSKVRCTDTCSVPNKLPDSRNINTRISTTDHA